MKIAVISFNNHGNKIAQKLSDSMEIDVYSKENDKNFNIGKLSQKLMKDYNAVIFISSTGIAVRAIAPFIVGKDKDPAVIVIDSFGKYVISLLSGHLGGANELTLKLSQIMQGQPIITTATDGLGIKAPDIIAKENHLIIDSLKDAKEISALLLDSRKVAFLDDEMMIEIPKGYSNSMEQASGIVYVTNRNTFPSIDVEKEYKTLKLIRKNIILGIGCKKNYSTEKMSEIVLKKLKEQNIDQRTIKNIATVEVKKHENAIIELARFFNVELKIFTIDEIKAVQHKYLGSDFVEKSIGVRSVCEPCVELCGGKLLTGKLSCDGMTLCVGKL